MTDKRCINHPDRPVRAQNRCGSCYVVGMRKGEITKMPSYVDELIYEVEEIGLTWELAEQIFKRTRTTISSALYRREGGREVIRAIQTKTYGVNGRSNINRVLPKKVNTQRYAESLIEELEFHPDWTWADARAQFPGKTQNNLYTALKNAGRADLIGRTSKNSGCHDTTPYLEDIIRYCELDADLTWGVLCQMLDKEETTVRRYLLKKEQGDLVKRLDKASGKGRVEL